MGRIPSSTTTQSMQGWRRSKFVIPCYSRRSFRSVSVGQWARPISNVDTSSLGSLFWSGKIDISPKNTRCVSFACQSFHSMHARMWSWSFDLFNRTFHCHCYPLWKQTFSTSTLFKKVECFCVMRAHSFRKENNLHRRATLVYNFIISLDFCCTCVTYSTSSYKSYFVVLIFLFSTYHNININCFHFFSLFPLPCRRYKWCQFQRRAQNGSSGFRSSMTINLFQVSIYSINMFLWYY